MNKPILHRAIALSIFAIAFLACWIAARLVADGTAEHEFADAVRSQSQLSDAAADNMMQMIASDLAMARAIPETIAEMSMVQDALAQARKAPAQPGATDSVRRAQFLSDPQLAAVDTFLHRAQGFSGLDAVRIINADAICVAANNAYMPASPVGTDLHATAYLRNALLGASAQAYGVGAPSGEPGIFISAPVYHDGALVGAIVAKVGIGRLRHWVARAGTFVTDENGVVVMAHESGLEGHVLPNSGLVRMGAADRMGRYFRKDFPVFDMPPPGWRLQHRSPWVAPEVGALLTELPGSDAPALYESRGGLNSGLTAHLVDPLVAWPALQRNHRNVRALAFVLLAGSLLLAYVIAVSYRREKNHHRAARHLAAQLQASNALLSAEARDDALTGALSRRYFLSLLEHEINAAHTSGKPLCLAIADLDYFKQINDRFGHASGDRALEHFVATCRRELRAGDAIGRLGGEEFGILLPATSLGDGVAVAERLRMRLATHPSPRLPAEVRVSVSTGIAELTADDSPERIMSRADRALYAAKAAGRNCTKAAPREDMAARTAPKEQV